MDFHNFNFVLFYCKFSNYIKFIAETFTHSSVKSWILVNESPLAGHLWFLGSMIYAMTIVVIFVKLKIFKYVSLASPLFSLVYILMAYSGKFSFIYCRNSIFCTMPYFMFGCVFRKYENRIKNIDKKATKIAFLSSFSNFFSFNLLILSFNFENIF